jgi:2-keto-myo-inositol isomerase
MKIGYNKGCVIKKSNLEMDLRFAEKYHYDYIEINLDKLKEYLETHALNDLKQFFQKNHLKPYVFNYNLSALGNKPSVV